MEPIISSEPYKGFLSQYQNTRTKELYGGELLSLAKYLKKNKTGVLEVTKQDLLDYFNTQKKLSGGSINLRITCYQNFFSWMKKEKFISEDPSNILDQLRMKVSDREIRGLNEEQRKKLLDNLKFEGRIESEISLTVLIGLYTGLDAGEILKLKWKDFILEVPEKAKVKVTFKKEQIYLPITKYIVEKLNEYKTNFPTPQTKEFILSSGKTKVIRSILNKRYKEINRWVDLGPDIKISNKLIQDTHLCWLLERNVPIKLFKNLSLRSDYKNIFNLIEAEEEEQEVEKFYKKVFE